MIVYHPFFGGGVSDDCVPSRPSIYISTLFTEYQYIFRLEVCLFKIKYKTKSTHNFFLNLKSDNNLMTAIRQYMDELKRLKPLCCPTHL